jgi:peptidyl-prolyl cis-trans isomerase B (cyclophilin B)
VRVLKRALPLLLVPALLLAGCGGGDSGDGDSGKAGDSSTAKVDRGTPKGTADPADVTCDYPATSYKATKDATVPPSKPTVGGDVKVTMKTTIGDLGLTLDATAAPCTVNSFVSLTEQGWYDGSFCQRLTTLDESGIAVLQCGDPSGTGLSSPGYQFKDELTGKETYGPGTVAMANAGPDTNSAQFFLVYDDTPLPPSYTVFGTLDDKGVQLVKDLAAKGTVNKGNFTAPKETVKVSQMIFG